MVMIIKQTKNIKILWLGISFMGAALNTVIVRLSSFLYGQNSVTRIPMLEHSLPCHRIPASCQN